MSDVVMRRDEHGDFVVSPEEMFVLRQGLFITIYHLDPTFETDLHTLTGVTHEEFVESMERLDVLGQPWSGS